MAETTVLSAKGTKAGKVELPDSLFAAPVNEALIHQAVVRSWPVSDRAQRTP
jgi:ribosomal protein L4